MDALIQPLPFDPAVLHRLSSGLIESHYQNNYGGAVKRLNALRAQLGTMAFAEVPGLQLNGLKREELIGTNSMLLDELYFGSLGGDGTATEPACKLALEANFGSVERWREESVAMGKALAGGSGWVLLVFQPREGRLVNQWAATTPKRWRATWRSWRWICTNTLTTWTTARQRVRMSMPSWPTSTGLPSRGASRGLCMPPASRRFVRAVASTAGRSQVGRHRPKEHRHEVDHP